MKSSVLSLRFNRLPAWIDVVFLSAVIGSFVGVWLLVVGQSSIDFDEGFSAYIARFNPLEIAYYTALDVHPPLYYVALHYWQLLFGSDVSILRMMSVSWGGVALIFAFLLVRRSFGRTAAWLATPLLAVEPLFFHYSGIMRMYSMAIAISLAATYILVRIASTIEHKQRVRLWSIYAVLVAIGMWTNYFTALVWLAHLAWLAYEQKQRGNSFRQFLRHSGWARAIGVSIVLFLPWLPAFAFRFAEVQIAGFWIKPISVDTLPSTLTMSTVYQTATNAKGWLMLVLVGGAVLLVLGAIQLMRSSSDSTKRALQLLIISSILPIALLILLSLPPLTSSYVYRYILPALCFGTLIIGIVLALVRLGKYEGFKKIALYIGIFVIFVSGCVESIRIGSQNLDSGKVTLISQMVAKLANVTGDSPVLAWSPYTYYVATAYEQPDHPIYYADTPLLEKIGSLKMLADHPFDRRIKDVAKFAQQYDSIWILAEDKPTAAQSPVNGWRQGRSITLTDPITGKQPAIAIEYLP